MAGCILRVAGLDFVPSDFLAGSSLVAFRQYVRGQPLSPVGRRSTQLHDGGGMCCDVSAHDDLAAQIRDALAFLGRHEEDLRRLADAPRVESRCLDSALLVQPDRVAASYATFPAELLLAAGRLRIDLETSVYLCDSTE